MTDHDTTPGAPETEALTEAWGQHRIWTQEDGQFSNCSCGGWGWNGDVSSAIPQFVTHRSQAVADSLSSDWLATRDAAQRAAARDAAMGAPETTETEALAELLAAHESRMGFAGRWHCSCGATGLDTAYADGERASHRDHMATILTDWLATRDAAQRAEAWREGAAAGHHSPLTWFALRQCNPYERADRIGGAS